MKLNLKNQRLVKLEPSLLIVFLAHSSQLTAHSSQLTAHNPQPTTHNPIFGVLAPFGPDIYRQGQEHDAENPINFALTLKGIIGFSRIETTQNIWI
ncbi:hypothetical protein ESY86_19355 [Subsaximicrobium wynnwilliamsii]|uniref:Uncharacterized protein n=1 Tax=Subsaximicrobium wynnwilliamsii TaxID=291179 RepID=A0A5C6ZCM4_9FLAO|nr:hypothetical protein [Subsaximicrobium wynnwilliamsii]TXD81091.1 hypothetical protein ESY87_19380 [Subsaximicrobium wynnwilliamsii]TXD86765.1 hypothetical protein ESY86_19355 [Subsaximicrobium wynnwilliamsii]TXE00394.1 hypothetical protein ESY88_19445 [Subsaximicrobium wynnwilliamsii]